MAKSVRDLLRFDGTLPDPGANKGMKDKDRAAKALAKLAPELAQLQERLYANGRHGGGVSALLLLQGMDASGKDGTVKKVVGLVNPAGCRITAFGPPNKEELAHDFLWRIEHARPGPGQLGVFNRSHYEDVLVVRVHDLVPRAVWSRRYARINTWERRVVSSGTPIIKVFLHISKAEQKKRLMERLTDPTKHWKVGAQDLEERKLWDAYQEAYLAALTKCSTDVAPWYVVPADNKWYRDWAIAHLLVETLRDMDLPWPPVPDGLDLKAMRKELKAE